MGYNQKVHKHIIQSPEWGRFKTEYGTKSYTLGAKLQYTLHDIPLTDYKYAYAPKVNSFDFDWRELKEKLSSHNCIAINFDVPNIIRNTKDHESALKIMNDNKCSKSPRDTFAKYNILLDIVKDEEKLLSNMHHKHRYNIKHAIKHGVEVSMGNTIEDFEQFFKLFEKTAIRQKYYIHPKTYYEKIWKIFKPLDIAHIATAYTEKTPIASWMIFTYKNVLYYPYGGSDETYKNLQASTLLAWETIKFGKKAECSTFDMWGASKDPTDTKDPWYGFTNFKLRFGGTHVEYMDSYDFVLNDLYYKLFNTANNIRWKLLQLKKIF